MAGSRSNPSVRPWRRPPSDEERRFERWIPSALGLGMVLLLSGCASVAEDGVYTVRQLAMEMARRGIDPSRIVLPYQLDDEMRAWAHETAPPELLPDDRLVALQERLLDPSQMRLEYVWGYTGTAREVFRSRQANCLAFTNLFLGMAREVGVPAYFLTVENLESFRREGDLVVVSDHIAVGWGGPQNPLIFDFSEFGNQDHRRVQRISDFTAIAMFYSNRGAEATQRGQVGDALSWLEYAVQLDPELPSAWVNLGVARRRVGDFHGAEIAYKEALALDPATHSAYQNLAALLRQQSRIAEAEGYEEELRRSPLRNPYTYLALGDISRQGGRFDDARRFYRRAVTLGREDPETHAALGQLAVATGDLGAARKLLRKARQLVGEEGENVRVRQLEEMISTIR